MNAYLPQARSLYSCCSGTVLCEHRLARPQAVPAIDGIDQEALRNLAEQRQIRVEPRVSPLLASPARRHAFSLGGALTGALGLGSLLPLAGCATAPAQPAAGSLQGLPGQQGLQPVPAGRLHVLESNAQTVRVGAMDPKAPPAVTVDSGDVVHYPNTWVNWANEAKYGMAFDEREPIRKRYPAGPYSLVGPVAVRGAEPGDWIECRMLKLRPIEWGWNSSPSGVGALPTEFKTPFLQYFKFDEARREARFNADISLPLGPTQGVIATMPVGDQPVSGILSGKHGGNIVLRELTEGSALFLPVQRSGGLVWTGDSHAAQGDGVVNQTAIETAMADMRIQFILHKRSPLAMLLAETPTHWIGIGYGENLETALTNCLRGMMDWLSAASRLSREEAYSLFSMAGSFRITQYAHQLRTVYANVPSKGVHGMLPKAMFSPQMVAAISRATRSGA